MKEKYVQRL